MPPSRIDGLIVEAIGDEVLVYDTEHDRAHALNAVAAAVWELSDGKCNAAALAAAAAAKIVEPVSEDAVWRALTQLDERGLLAGELPSRISGPEYSRRVRRVCGAARQVDRRSNGCAGGRELRTSRCHLRYGDPDGLRYLDVPSVLPQSWHLLRSHWRGRALHLPDRLSRADA